MISVLTWKRQSEHYSVSLLPLVFVYAIERCLGTGFGDVLIYRPQLTFCLRNTCMPQGFYRLKKFRQERSRVVKFDLFSGTRLIFSLSTELFFCSKVFNLRTGQLVVPEDKNVRRELLNEAEFYRIQGIIDELRSQPFEGSLILSTEHRQILTSWLQA